jgi:hypothetical protein
VTTVLAGPASLCTRMSLNGREKTRRSCVARTAGRGLRQTGGVLTKCSSTSGEDAVPVLPAWGGWRAGAPNPASALSGCLQELSVDGDAAVDLDGTR